MQEPDQDYLLKIVLWFLNRNQALTTSVRMTYGEEPGCSVEGSLRRWPRTGQQAHGAWGRPLGRGVVAGQDARKSEPSALGPIRAPDPRIQCGLSLLSTSRPPEPGWKFSFLTLPQDLCLTLPGLTVSLSPPSAWGPALGTCIVAGTRDLDRGEHVNISCNGTGPG